MTSAGVLVVWTVGLLILAGLFEIGGGWLVWRFMRKDDVSSRVDGHHQWYFLLTGFIALCLYGLIPTFQPDTSNNTFARVYAGYGGIFVIMSLLFGWAVDGTKPDIGDWVGAGIAVTGVLLILFWPR